VSTLDSAFNKIKEKDFDVLLTVGAGNIDTLCDGIVQWLSNKK
jgi:UDP-N-acetylmuramate--alanine ligase